MLSRRIENNDAGVTLIELMVGMTLMTIVGALALNFFVGTTAQANRVGQQSMAAASARAAMNQIAQTLQVADSQTTPGASTNRFVTITATDLAFFSDFSASSRSGTSSRATPSLVEFTLSNGTLTESITPPGSTTPSKNTLVTGVTNTSVFSYCSDATDPSTTCTATSNPTSVAMVQVSLSVLGMRQTTPQTLQTGIAIGGALT